MNATAVLDVVENAAFSLSADDADFLQARLGGHIERQASGWVISRVVGHLWLPSQTLLRVRSPKASGASVLAWMAFVDPSLRALRWMRAIPESAGDGDIASLAARLYAIELDRAIGSNGIRRAYFRTRVKTMTVRGRIDFAASSRAGGSLGGVVCELWERQPHTPLNRFLAAALRRVERDASLRVACGEKLGRVSALFSCIPPRVVPEILSGQRELDRTEAPFEAACALARILLAKTTLGEGRSQTGTGFLINLDSLFERTVVRALRDANVAVVGKHPVSYVRVASDGSERARTFELDAWCPSASAGPIVVDAKYKLRVSAANIQQLVTYCFLTGARRGAFVVPAGLGADVRPVRLRAPSGDTIEIHTLELATNATSVEAWKASARALGIAFREQYTQEPNTPEIALRLAAANG